MGSKREALSCEEEPSPWTTASSRARRSHLVIVGLTMIRVGPCLAWLTAAASMRTPGMLTSAKNSRLLVSMSNKEEDRPALPEKAHVPKQGGTRSLEVNGETLLLDELGPVVLQENGRMGRLSNWQDMTEHEQQMTLKFVAKRNKQRRAALLRNKDDGNTQADSSSSQ